MGTGARKMSACFIKLRLKIVLFVLRSNRLHPMLVEYLDQYERLAKRGRDSLREAQVPVISDRVILGNLWTTPCHMLHDGMPLNSGAEGYTYSERIV